MYPVVASVNGKSARGFVFHSFDSQYLRNLQDGDPETERHFVTYFSELLRIKLRSRLRSAQLVEDLRQETFARVLAVIRRDGLETPESLGAFVNSVCRNLLHELFRYQSRGEPVSFDNVDVPDGHADAESAMLSEENRELVRRVLAELPEKDRALLRALFYEERDREEICRSFRVKPENLRVLIHRAKARLRRHLVERHGENFLNRAGA